MFASFRLVRTWRSGHFGQVHDWMGQVITGVIEVGLLLRTNLPQREKLIEKNGQVV